MATNRIVLAANSDTRKALTETDPFKKIYTDHKGLEFSFEWIGNEGYLKPIMEFVDKNYIQREPVSQMLGLHNSINYKKLIENDIANSLKKNLVLVARHQKKIVACSINNDYFEDIFNKSNEINSEEIKVFSAFFDQLEHPFIKEILPLKKQDIFYANMSCVAQEYAGLSIKLTESFTYKAFELGYKYIVAIATSKQVENSFIRRFKYETIQEMYYKNFDYKGKKPFISAEQGERCILVVKKSASN